MNDMTNLIPSIDLRSDRFEIRDLSNKFEKDGFLFLVEFKLFDFHSLIG